MQEHLQSIIDYILIFVCYVIIDVYNVQGHLILNVDCAETRIINGQLIQYVKLIVQLWLSRLQSIIGDGLQIREGNGLIALTLVQIVTRNAISVMVLL